MDPAPSRALQSSDVPDPQRPVFVRRQGPARPGCRSRERVAHPHPALAFYLEGSATIEQRGRWSIRAGDVLLVPAGEPHRATGGEGGETWALGFWAGSLVAADGAPLLAPFERVRSGGAAVVSIPEGRRAFLGGLFAELSERVAGAGAGALAVQRSLLTLILAEVQRAASSGDDDRPVAGGLVADSLRFIEARCLGKLSLREVAEEVGRSPAHVTTTLKRATGRSALQWILAGRLAEARRLLLHTDERVDLIAERVGYDDSTHFIRLFRRESGLTPAAWRARQRTERRP